MSKFFLGFFLLPITMFFLIGKVFYALSFSMLWQSSTFFIFWFGMALYFGVQTLKSFIMKLYPYVLCFLSLSFGIAILGFYMLHYAQGSGSLGIGEPIMVVESWEKALRGEEPSFPLGDIKEEGDHFSIQLLDKHKKITFRKGFAWQSWVFKVKTIQPSVHIAWKDPQGQTIEEVLYKPLSSTFSPFSLTTLPYRLYVKRLSPDTLDLVVFRSRLPLMKHTLSLPGEVTIDGFRVFCENGPPWIRFFIVKKPPYIAFFLSLMGLIFGVIWKSFKR